jgi:hypothetical protein
LDWAFLRTISSDFLYELIVLDGIRLKKFFAKSDLGVHAGLSRKTGAVLVDSRRSSHRLVADPDAEEAGGCEQVSNADRTNASGSSPFFARTVVAVIERLGSYQRLCRRFIPENLCITPAAVSRRALAELTSSK